MDNSITRLVALANDYCVAVENSSPDERDDFVAAMTDMLPRLYWEFSHVEESIDQEEDFPYTPSYMDEDYYDSIRRRLEAVLGEEDTYLETQHEDMKFSDVPIGASIAEGLADIFQDLFNFVAMVRDSDLELAPTALAICRDNFATYWSQTLCNVMRPLNHLRYFHTSD